MPASGFSVLDRNQRAAAGDRLPEGGGAMAQEPSRRHKRSDNPSLTFVQLSSYLNLRLSKKFLNAEIVIALNGR